MFSFHGALILKLSKIHNPLDADLVFELVQSDAGVNGEVFAHFSQGFSSFIVPAGQTVSSGTFDNVLLTQGALASLDIIPLGRLDVSAASTVRVGQGGYQVPWLKIEQKDVPTTYNLALDGLSLRQAAQRVNATSSSTSLSDATLSTSMSIISKSDTPGLTTDPGPSSPTPKPDVPSDPSPTAPAAASTPATDVSGKAKVRSRHLCFWIWLTVSQIPADASNVPS